VQRAARTSRSRPRKQRAQQTELVFRNWGGARPGAGRKPKGERPMLPHDKRPPHKASVPVLITTRLLPGLPSLRRPGEAARIRAALSSARAAAGPEGSPRAPFQVVHYSIQSNHLHLIVEATDRAAMTSGMRGLLVRIARALNRLWGRSGRIFGDRFHERELRNPRQVRNALVYVLQNLRKHGICMDGPDPLSSGPEFHGWRPAGAGTAQNGAVTASPGGGAGALRTRTTLLRAGRVDLPRPHTWLLGVGWQRHGLIDLDECPVVR
jgi:REP element-mobilizing transposase RayT